MHPQELGQSNNSDDDDDKAIGDDKVEENKLLDELLTTKKKYVIEKLLDNLSLMKRGNDGLALSTQQILIDLIEIDKTLSIFYEDDARLLKRMMALISDTANTFNHKYLMAVL